jgi:hypothetical protein
VDRIAVIGRRRVVMSGSSAVRAAPVVGYFLSSWQELAGGASRQVGSAGRALAAFRAADA